MKLVVVGVSHHTADLALRERLAFSLDDLESALAGLRQLPAVSEGAIVSTCNRVEIYAVTSSMDIGAASLRSFLATSRGVAPGILVEHVYEHTGKDALKHMFRVASSLDSLMVGESQILGQLKDAYGRALRSGALRGVLSRCFERAFSVAKRVRTETGIARHAVSVSSAAVELAGQIFGDLAGSSVLVIGAGKMSGLAARHLRAAGCARIAVVNRSPKRALELAEEVSGRAHDWSELDVLLAEADVVISSTGANEPVLTRDRLKPIVKRRKHRPLFLIDIAVPRDIEPAAGGLDNIFLYDLDALEKVVSHNRGLRIRESEYAERIVGEEVVLFERWLKNLDVEPTIRELRKRAEDIAKREVARTVEHFPELSEGGRKRLEAMAHSIVNKLLHPPTAALRRERGQELAAHVCELFELSLGEIVPVETEALLSEHEAHARESSHALGAEPGRIAE